MTLSQTLDVIDRVEGSRERGRKPLIELKTIGSSGDRNLLRLRSELGTYHERCTGSRYSYEGWRPVLLSKSLFVYWIETNHFIFSVNVLFKDTFFDGIRRFSRGLSVEVRDKDLTSEQGFFLVSGPSLINVGRNPTSRWSDFTTTGTTSVSSFWLSFEVPLMIRWLYLVKTLERDGDGKGQRIGGFTRSTNSLKLE